ncbi:MAG TPA: hypothetical protein DEG88_06760 [Propionibacteriaceae bacterium]|jgi:hypothetical protein|nr:hypothetical protein [Micropruina sp.]HBY22983.1 hypothetical protein [Propionibacteriaceae bacterium]
MQFLVSVIANGREVDDPSVRQAISAFNQRLQAAGHRVFAGGLAAPDEAIVLDNRAAAGLSIPGPFVRTDEFVAGFWILEADSLDVALALAAEGSLHCNRRVEVRPLL